MRRRAWQGREVVLEPESWPRSRPGPSAEQRGAQRAAGGAPRAISEQLTPHQREVFVALALNEVPIDVLAERLDTTRGALYKTLHDARRKLRAELAAGGLRGRRPMTERDDEPPSACSGRPARSIGCDECFERLDEYVELELRGADADARIPGMRAHLDGCPACREEHESLRALLS